MTQRPKKAIVKLANGNEIQVYRWYKDQNIYIDSSDCKTEYKAENLTFVREP